MSDLTIKTSGREYPVLYWQNLTRGEQKEFDYMDTEAARCDASFVRYRGVVYDLNEFSRCPEEMKNWHGCKADSFYSGVCIRYTDDMEGVFCGTYYA